MILGFLGKGGSGKSSVATQVALLLRAQEKKVLAIDADHNMDLSFNLLDSDTTEGLPYFGSCLNDILSYVGLQDGQRYDEVFLNEIQKRFFISPPDEITSFLSKKVDDGLLVMIAGPQTDKVLYGESCSHSLTTPLKVYLPLLDLQKNEYVVVDEKAGADGVSTGIVTGIDVGVIVCEPAIHSIKTALQIAELMNFYETPYIFVGNKIQSNEDRDFIVSQLGQEPTIYLSESSNIKRNPGMLIEEWGSEIKTIIEKAHLISKNNRLEKTKRKFIRNKKFTDK